MLISSQSARKIVFIKEVLAGQVTKNTKWPAVLKININLSYNYIDKEPRSSYSEVGVRSENWCVI